MKRLAKAIWIGSAKDGYGHVSTQSLSMNKVEYSLSSRFQENQSGTSPEELLGAAHAGCFTMKLCELVSDAGYIPEIIETSATITMENELITESHLDVKAKVPGIDTYFFDKCAEKAKKNCPLSKALNITISLNAQLTN